MALPLFAQTLGDAERRRAEPPGGALPLLLDARVLRGVRAPLRGCRRAPDRRLLRHDPGPRRRDEAGAGRAGRRRAADLPVRASPSRHPPRPRRRPMPSSRRSASSRPRSSGRSPSSEFVVSVELDPPKGLNPTRIVNGAALLADVGRRLHQHRRQPDGPGPDGLRQPGAPHSASSRPGHDHPLHDA